MKPLMKLAALLLLGVSLYAQAFRIDPFPSSTIGTNIPVGAYAPILAIPGAVISLCTTSSCTVPATSYTDATGMTACPAYAPVTWPGTSTCVSTSNLQGRFGFWLATGQYYYRVIAAGQNMGTYAISIGGGGGSGAVSSVFGRTGAVLAQSGDYAAFYDALGAAATAQATAIATAEAFSANASNLSSGTIPSGRLPIATPIALGSFKPDGATIAVDGVTGVASLVSNTVTVNSVACVLGSTCSISAANLSSGPLSSRTACDAPGKTYLATDQPRASQLSTCDGTNWTTVITAGTGLVIIDGVLCVDSTVVQQFAGVKTGRYSAAGTPVPTCNGGALGTQITAIDVTTNTFGATYVSGGTHTSALICNESAVWVVF